MVASCKTTEYKDGYEKGLKKGKKLGFVMGYEKARDEWYKRGVNDGYQKGSTAASGQVANKWYNKGVNEGYEFGLKKGKTEGYREGTQFFIKKWWKPSLGFVMLLLVSVFVFFTIFLLIRKGLKRFAEKITKAIEYFRVSIKMERVLKDESKQ
jgi:flagellar biosynthesis/type III secretory pathway protein FliH